MLAQDALEPGAEALDGRAALLVESVGADRHPEHTPVLERMCEQQQLRLAVDGAALRIGGQPRAADLHLRRAAAARIPGDVHEAGATHRSVVGEPALHERHHQVSFGVGEQPVDVGAHRVEVGGHGRVAIGAAVPVTGSEQCRRMVV